MNMKYSNYSKKEKLYSKRKIDKKGKRTM